MSKYELPYRDERGICNIFLSAIGGDGANMAAKLFFKIGVEEIGLDGAYDAKYGSEKTGTPTDVSVRFCEAGTLIRESGPTNHPHILCVFHDDLIELLELYRGIHRNPTVIVNTTKSPAEIREIMRLPEGILYTLDASRIVKETNSRINIPMLAMLCRVMNFPEEVAKNSIAKQWPSARVSNIAAYESSMKSYVSVRFENDGRYEYMPPKPIGSQLGYMNILNGGSIDALTHSTYGRRNQVAGRGFVPVYNPDLCTGCALCMTVCSDPGALIWVDSKVADIDLTFCKGCMRCVEICPETKKGRALMRPQAMSQ